MLFKFSIHLLKFWQRCVDGINLLLKCSDVALTLILKGVETRENQRIVIATTGKRKCLNKADKCEKLFHCSAILFVCIFPISVHHSMVA